MKLTQEKCLPRVLCAVLAAQFLSAPQLFGVEPNISGGEAASLLQFTADEIKSNSDRIRTWRGQYELISWSRDEAPVIFVTDESTQESAEQSQLQRRQLNGTFIRQQETEGEFVADLKGNRLYSTYRVVGDTQFDQVDGDLQLTVPVDPEAAIDLESILTASEFLQTDRNARFTRVRGFPDLPESPGGYRMVYRQPPESGQQLSRVSTLFDPRRLLESGGRRIDFMFSTLSAWIENETQEVSVTSPDDSTYKVQYEYTTGEKTTKTLSLIDNCLVLTESLLEHPRRGTFQDTWEYRQESDQLLPFAWSCEHRDVDGQLQYGRQVRLHDIRINDPVTDDEFDPSRFSMRPLDRLVDEVEGNIELFLNSETTISANDYRSDMLDADVKIAVFTEEQPLHAEMLPVSGYSSRYLLISANLGLIALIAMALFWQRFRTAI